MWDHHSALIRHALSAKLHKDWSPDDFTDALDGLGESLVNEKAYTEAANYGRKAVPGTYRDDSDPVAHVWIDHVNPYAQRVPERIAQQLADEAFAADTPGASAQDILDRIDAKLAALRSSITRYAEPMWGTGQQSYGEQLSANDVLIAWHLDDGTDHCDVCPEIAAGGPYERGDLPTWPGLGETPCLDHCHCWIEADEESWNDAFAA